jgi:hypothetical protein
MVRILTSKNLMPPRIDQNKNPDVEFFVAPKNPDVDFFVAPKRNPDLDCAK